MKKHNNWQKNRNRLRRQGFATREIEQADRDRANWFNREIGFAQAAHKEIMKEDEPGFAWFIHMPPTSEWPNVIDMYFEHKGSIDTSAPEGIYHVSRVATDGNRDLLLDAWNMTTGTRHFVWFPRIGQSVIPCTEV